MLPAELIDPAIKVIIPDDDACLCDVAEKALAEKMHLIHVGRSVVLCSIIPSGLTRMAIKNKSNQPNGQNNHFSALGANSGDVLALPVIKTAAKISS